ncbi:MAG: hypothetical protein KDK48_06445, partial [Chlamydiia bacterium]|nr:hypothetical protein [Chlamydiia bacterium]
MQIYEHLSDLPPLSCCLTIGFFDGMHLGHQAVLKKLLEAAKEENVQPALLSFRNHPRSVLKPDSHLDFITPLLQRLELIEKAGVQTLFLLPFTLEFSRQSPEEFLKALTDTLELKRLILGHDAL